jgi:hypothetical protein
MLISSTPERSISNSRAPFGGNHVNMRMEMIGRKTPPIRPPQLAISLSFLHATRLSPIPPKPLSKPMIYPVCPRSMPLQLCYSLHGVRPRLNLQPLSATLSQQRNSSISKPTSDRTIVSYHITARATLTASPKWSFRLIGPVMTLQEMVATRTSPRGWKMPVAMWTLWETVHRTGGLWFAGEHTAPFLHMGTATGAYVAGEEVAKRICDIYGMERCRL